MNDYTPDNYSNELSGFTRLCKMTDLSENKGKKIIVDTVEVALFRKGENIYALNNVCPHLHASVMHDGMVEGDCVLCPSHGWEFNLADGRLKDGRKGLDSYEVKIIDGFVYAKVYEKKLNW